MRILIDRQLPIIAAAVIVVSIAPACGNEAQTGAGSAGPETVTVAKVRSGGEREPPGGTKGKSANRQVFDAEPQTVEDTGDATLREAREDGNPPGFLMNDKLEVAVQWKTNDGVTLTPIGHAPVTASEGRATTMLDLKKLVLPKLGKLATEGDGGSARFPRMLALKVEVSRNGKLTDERWLHLRFDDALAWLLRHTVGKGEPLLAPGESTERSGKGRYISVSRSEVDETHARSWSVSLLYLSGAGPFVDFDFVQFSDPVYCGAGAKRKDVGPRYTMYDRRTGKKVGEQVFLMGTRCPGLKGAVQASPKVIDAWLAKVMK